MKAAWFTLAVIAGMQLLGGISQAESGSRWTSPPYLQSPPLAVESPADVQGRVIEISTFPTVLDARLWGPDGKMHPAIRARVLEVVNELFAELRLKDVTIGSVEVRGSNTSYEYDADADLGVKALLDTSAYKGDVAELSARLKLFDKLIEREHEPQVFIRGMPLEINFYANRDDRMAPQKGIGQYSISEDRWIEEPTVQKDEFDRTQMTSDTLAFLTRYNKLVTEYFQDKPAFDCRQFGDLSRELSKYRDAGIKKSGIRSTENLTYRLLRRLSVNVIEKVQDLALECRNIHWSLE